jgi:hypothetical protein
MLHLLAVSGKEQILQLDRAVRQSQRTQRPDPA